MSPGTSAVPPDIEIANAAYLRRITEVARESLGIEEANLVPYGHHKAKIDLGYLATYAAAALVDGDISGEEGDSFEAGDLGEFEVGADGTVLLGEPFTFDKSNIADFDF